MRRMELPQHFEQLSLAGGDYRRWSRPGQRQLSVQPRALPGVLPGSPVRPVQPDGVEAVSYALDLTAEIRRVETAFALRARRRVRGGYDRRSLREQGLEHLLYDERSEEHTSELQSRGHLVCRLLLEKKNKIKVSLD